MTFQPGVASNPAGRPKGARNRRTQEVLDLIEGRGDKDPLDALSEIITTNKDPSIVATASSILAPYVHSKRGALVPPRFIGEPVQVPEFQSTEDAERFLADLPRRVGLGELDFQSGLDLSTLTKNWISAKYEREELQLKLAANKSLAPEQHIRIEGGLPELPGTNVIMPHINGASGQGAELHHNGATLDLEKNSGTELPAPDAAQDPQP